MQRLKRWGPYLLLSYPVGWLVVFFLIPLAFLVLIGFYRNVPGGGWEAAFTLDNYVRFFTRDLYWQRLIFTLELSALTALLCLLIGYPFTYALVRLVSPFWRRVGLMAAISTLWLTYVVRSYAWSVLLSSTSGIGKLLAFLGFVETAPSFAPGYAATLIGLVYVFLPFMILSLYGSLRAIDPALEEASLNLGARPWHTFIHVILPLSLPGAVAGTGLVFLLTLGNYVVPSILGQPAQWTMPVIITDQVTREANVPFGAALSLILTVVVIGLIGLGTRIAGVAGAGSYLGAAGSPGRPAGSPTRGDGPEGGGAP